MFCLHIIKASRESGGTANLSKTSALDERICHLHAPAALPLGKGSPLRIKKEDD
jgi:hypothetical protein